jgi:hypothetical protein
VKAALFGGQESEADLNLSSQPNPCAYGVTRLLQICNIVFPNLMNAETERRFDFEQASRWS